MVSVQPISGLKHIRIDQDPFGGAKSSEKKNNAIKKMRVCLSDT